MFLRRSFISWKSCRFCWYLLLLFSLLSFFNACSRCSDKDKAPQTMPEKDEKGALNVYMHKSLYPFLRHYQKGEQAGLQDRNLMFHAATTPELLEAAKTGKADCLLLLGEESLEDLKKKEGIWKEARAFAANLVELAVRKGLPHEIDSPMHLLQPVLKGPAIVSKEEATGVVARNIISGYRLSKRLAPKLLTFPDSEAAIRALVQRKVDSALVLRTERIRAVKLSTKLALSTRPVNFIQYYVAVPKTSLRPNAALHFADWLEKRNIPQRLRASGFLSAERVPYASDENEKALEEEEEKEEEQGKEKALKSDKKTSAGQGEREEALEEKPNEADKSETVEAEKTNKAESEKASQSDEKKAEDTLKKKPNLKKEEKPKKE